MEGLQRMKHLKSAGLVLLAAVIAVSSYMIMPWRDVDAQGGSAALSIVPKKTYTVEPGKAITDRLTIRNQDREEALHLSLSVVDFTYNDKSGAPKLMLDPGAPQTAWSLKPYLQVPETVTIEPGESVSVDMKLDMPAKNKAGSYYSAIVYSSGSSEGGNVGLSASGVTLVFANIPGEVKEELELQKLGAYRNADTSTTGAYGFFHINKPERIAYDVENRGNVAESPVGQIVLKPLFGEEITIQNINPSGSLALIGQTRTFLTCIALNSSEVDFKGTRAEASGCAEPNLWPGYYSIELTAYYGHNGNQTKDLFGKGGFWYLPWWFIIVTIAVLAYVGYQTWKLVRYIRRKKNGELLKKPKKHKRKK